MSPSAHPRTGHIASRATGVLALGVGLCLVSAPNAFADGEAYLVAGNVQTMEGVLHPGGGQGLIAEGPTLSSPFQVTTPPDTVVDTNDFLQTAAWKIHQITLSITGPQPDIVNSHVVFSDISVPNGFTADEIDSQCTVGPGEVSGTTTFKNLVINGVTMPDNPASNTVVTIPRGTVTLNEVTNPAVGADSVEVKPVNVDFTQPVDGYGAGDLVFGDVECRGKEGVPVVMPVGAVGGLLLTGVLGVLFAVRQLRRRPA